MSPSRRPLEFGVSVLPTSDGVDAARRIVRAAEEGGIDLVGIQDHPYQARFLDTWFLIATLLAETRRLRFFPNVANLPLRHPAMMAKQAATLDVLSGRRSVGESVDALIEAVEILRRAWSGEEEVTFEGRHYRIEGFQPGPPPAHRIEIWLGAYKPRMLRVTGRLADGWIPSMGYLPPDELGARSNAVDEAAREAGRDPAEVRHAYNVSGAITDGERGDGPLDGPTEHWVETLSGWAERLAVDTFVLWPSGDDPAAQVERFARDVVPAVRRAAQ